jgi:hypothetical protein
MLLQYNPNIQPNKTFIDSQKLQTNKKNRFLPFGTPHGAGVLELSKKSKS